MQHISYQVHISSVLSTSLFKLKYPKLILSHLIIDYQNENRKNQKKLNWCVLLFSVLLIVFFSIYSNTGKKLPFTLAFGKTRLKIILISDFFYFGM